MRLTISPDDSCIIKDGVPLNFAFSAPAGWHAVQWYGSHGTIEMKEGEPIRFSDLATVQPFADAYDAEAARLVGLAPKPPTAAAIRKAQVKGRLAQIDSESARPSREIAAALAAAKPAPAFAKNKLDTLEAEAAALRAELAGL